MTEEAPKPEAQTEDKGESLLNKEVPKKDEKAPAAPAGAPEKYEFKLPDGFALDETASKEIDTLFREIGLGQDHAQKLVDYYVQKNQEAVEAPFKLWADTQKAWVDEIKADKDLGGRLPEVKTTIARAIDGLGDPKLAESFREAMDITGAGNNPAFIRAFYKLAQQVTEGGHVAGNGPAPQGQTGPGSRPASAGAALYPNLPHA